MKIHLVYDSTFKDLKTALEEEGHTVIWDYSLEQFAVFAESQETDADAALIDGTAGGLKLEEVYQLLKHIRKNLVDLRIIIQFPKSLSLNRDLINKLIGLNIYDIRFYDEFTIEDVEHWLNHRMTLADLRYDGEKLEGKVEQSVEYATPLDEETDEEKPAKRLTFPKISLPKISFPKREKQVKQEKEKKLVAEEPKEEYREQIQQEVNTKQSANVSTDREIIVLYSPVPSGKTFVGVNLAVAIARTGAPTIFMDSTEYCGAKFHFNAPSFPFKLSDIPLTVAPYDESLFKEKAVFVIETNSPKYVPHGAKVIAVMDSDYAHQLITAKHIHEVEVQGVFWNQKDAVCDPTKLITLPLIATIPYFKDTNSRIKSGVPRALEDDQLCEVLLAIREFDPVEYMLMRA